MDDATFDMWMKYHFSLCERMDLIGATNHALDILAKNNIQNIKLYLSMWIRLQGNKQCFPL